MKHTRFIIPGSGYTDVDTSKLRSTAFDWFDGGNSAMYKFGAWKDCDARRLLGETMLTIDGCVFPDKLPGLEALLLFAGSFTARNKAEEVLEKALNVAVTEGVDRRRMSELYEAADRQAQTRDRMEES